MNTPVTHPVNLRFRSRKGCPCGLTLIEVVAAIALLGTLMVSILLAKGRSIHQWSLAEKKQAAVEAADRLLESWFASSSSGRTQVPINAQGDLPDQLQWRTLLLPWEPPLGLSAGLVRLIISSKDDAGNEKILVEVDVFVATPDGSDLEEGGS